MLSYQPKGLLLDSNLLVLLIIGSLEAKRIETFRRTRNQGFTQQDYLLLQRVSVAFAKMVTTPHILTETVNFVRELDGHVGDSALQLTSKLIQCFKERRPESKKLVQSDFFPRFGLTDTAILDLPPKKYLVLSVDAPLVIALQKKGIHAINFNHIRQTNWQQ